MPLFLPPETRELRGSIARRNARRARLALRHLAPMARSARRLASIRAMRASLAGARGERRLRLLAGPELRAWLHDASEAIALSRRGATREALFAIVAAGPHLRRVVPRGRIDAGFPSRLDRLARELVDQLFRSTPPGARHDHRHQSLDGSRILLAPRVVSRPEGLVRRGQARGVARRLGRALALLERAWPDARREVEAHTVLVVPLVERGTVSFSLAGRPGVSYINTRGKSLVDLADDLLHETAHHRLHGLEETARLVRDDGEPRYRSPWRRSLRPVRGILHGVYSFCYRAELFRRLLLLPGELPRRWLRRELRWELHALAEGIAMLRDARRRGLLTPQGMDLLVRIERRHARIRRSARAGPRRSG